MVVGFGFGFGLAYFGWVWVSLGVWSWWAQTCAALCSSLQLFAACEALCRVGSHHRRSLVTSTDRERVTGRRTESCRVLRKWRESAPTSIPLPAKTISPRHVFGGKVSFPRAAGRRPPNNRFTATDMIDVLLRLVESISLIFLHVATTTSPSAIDDAIPLYFHVALK